MSPAIAAFGAAYDAATGRPCSPRWVGASATLTGLVFVAVSINITRILDSPGLPERAAKTLVILLSGLVISIVVLMPGQSQVALGIEIGATAITSTAVQLIFVRILIGHDVPPKWVAEQALVALVIAVPLLTGAVSLIVAGGGGLFWIVGGMVVAILGAVFNAWVLLLEILR